MHMATKKRSRIPGEKLLNEILISPIRTDIRMHKPFVPNPSSAPIKIHFTGFLPFPNASPFTMGRLYLGISTNTGYRIQNTINVAYIATNSPTSMFPTIFPKK